MSVDRPILDDSTVQELRALNEGNLPHCCTVTVAPTSGTRVGGALVDTTPVALFTDIPCRLTVRRLRAHEAEIGQQQSVRGQYLLTCRAGVTLPHGAVAVVNGSGEAGDWTLSVRVGARMSSLVYEIGARYAVEDVNIGGR